MFEVGISKAMWLLKIWVTKMHLQNSLIVSNITDDIFYIQATVLLS